MYQVLIDGAVALDPVSEGSCVTSASVSQEVNAAAYLDLVVGPGPEVREGESEVDVLWDGATLFHGRVTDVTLGVDGTRSVTAVSGIESLDHVLCRPHSTDGSVGERCPDTVAGYFQWLVDELDRNEVGGYGISVGVNEGDGISTGALSLSVDSWPTVARQVEDVVLSRGGYLDFRPGPDGGTVDLYADVHEASGQLVDLGENVVSLDATRSVEDMVTAVVPYSGDLTLAGASDADAELASNAGFSLRGEVIYSPEAVARYGYREERHEVDGAEGAADLVRGGAARLRAAMSPTLSVTCRAVDMALYRDGYEHLRVGQAVRVRSALHGLDEYMVVRSEDLDLMDPSQTTYTLGVSYDTLTGYESRFLSDLNAGINHALDRVDGMQSQVDGVVDNVQQVQQDVDGVRQDVTEAVDVANGAQQTASDAKDAADAAKDAASRAEQAADEMAGQIEGVNVKIEGLQGDLDHVSTQISGAVESANAALEASSQAVQDVNGFKTTVSQTYATKDELSKETLDRESAITQSAESILAQVSEEYVDKETGETLATKSEVEQSAEGIRSEVASEYQSKDGMSSYATKTYVDQRDDSISSTVSQVSQTADSALEKASTVEQTASGLTIRLTQAERDVETAQSAASSAQTSASQAQSTANSASSTASSALSTANRAQSTAQSAQSAASDAQDAAEDAAKTATNFLEFASGGLTVGNMTASSLGANVRIGSDSIDVRDGSTTLASYGRNRVQLGANSSTATIEMCRDSFEVGGSGNLMTVKARGSFRNLQLGIENTAVGDGTLDPGIKFVGSEAYGRAEVTAPGGMTLNGSYVPFGNKRLAIYQGKKTITATSENPLLLSSAEYRSIVGRPWDGDRDCLFVMNGNSDASGIPCYGSFYSSVSGNLGVQLGGNPNGLYQVNFVIVAGTDSI